MSRGLAKLLQIVNMIAMVVLMLIFMDIPAVAYIIAFLCVIIAIFLSYCLRCPHCGAWPRKGSLFHEYCPRCGKHLGD